MNAQSNPSLCQHSMVTDLCGLCIRDQRIAELEQQRDELLDVLADAVSALEVCGKDYRATEIARELLAKHRGQA